MNDADILIVGAGAAGLTAAIWAGRTNPRLSIAGLDGARRLGAKILVAGGGRCNVTHDVVDAADYAGSSRNAIKKVLRRFDVPQTIAFFRELGVELKREETGKLFPTTDDAHTVLDAMLRETERVGVTLLHPRRVETVERCTDGFRVAGAWGMMTATRVILATGGRALPKSGSDGQGYALAQALGHTITRYVYPALVPLTLAREHYVAALSGVTVPATLDVRATNGKLLASFTDSTLLTHFGLSGPSALNISRYYLDAKQAEAETVLTVSWLPGKTMEEVERDLQMLGHSTPLRYLLRALPERLARAILTDAGIDPATTGDQLPRERRKALARAITQSPLPVTGNRGYTYAEATAGGVPLSEIRLETMESRLCPGLYLCGELCDVDGRIGGFNFQWAWSSGYVAGVAAAESMATSGEQEKR
jgi:predicted Rossmann fold flavoprotein